MLRTAMPVQGGATAQGEEVDVESSNVMLCEPPPTAAQAALASPEFTAVLDELTHAVVNALNTAVAASELVTLLLARDKHQEAARPLANIEPECLRAARLLRDGRRFMTFAIDPGRERVDMVALMRSCAESCDDHAVHIETGQPEAVVRGDAAALQRMCMEILGNAFQFGAGKVDVLLDADAGGEVRIDFRDDGPGIRAPATRLFDAFFSTDPAHHSGLGLTLARRIAAAHGGAIGTEASALGAAFWIRLPARSA